MVRHSRKVQPLKLGLLILGWIVMLMLASGQAWGQEMDKGEEGNMIEYQDLTPDLLVENVDATVAWWSDMFGFELVQSVPEAAPFDFAIMNAGGASVMFQLRNNLAGEYERFRNAKPGEGFTLFVKMKGVEALYERLKGRANIMKAPEKTFYGALEIAVVDPNSITVVFAEFDE